MGDEKEFINKAMMISKEILDSYNKLIKLDKQNLKNTPLYNKELLGLSLNIKAEETVYKEVLNPKHASELLKTLEFYKQSDEDEFCEEDELSYEAKLKIRITEKLENIANKDYLFFYNNLCNIYLGLIEDAISDIESIDNKEIFISYDNFLYNFISSITEDINKMAFVYKYYPILRNEFDKRFISIIENNNNKSYIDKKYYTYYFNPTLENEMLKNKFDNINLNFNDCIISNVKGDQDYKKQLTIIYGLIRSLDYLSELLWNNDDYILNENDYDVFINCLYNFKTALLFLDKASLDEIRLLVTNYFEKYNGKDSIDNVIKLILEAIDKSNDDYDMSNSNSKIKKLIRD